MARVYTTVDDAVNQVRRVLDEINPDTIDTQQDILPTMNRAQDFATQIYASKYPEPILTYTTLDLVAGTAEYSIPEDSFEDNLTKVEISIGGTMREVQRISYRDISAYESPSRSSTPDYYCVVGRNIRLLPTPTGAYDARIWYLRQPDELVLQQGRITLVNTGSNYVLVDAVGDAVTTESDNLGSYLNLVDGQTGLVKGTLQVQSVSGDRITFRSSPIRTSVLNRDIGTTLAGLGVAADDYLAPVQGTCVIQFGVPLANFIIQYTVAELTRKLGGDAATEEQILEKFERKVSRVWVGREQQLRVKKRSSAFGTTNIRRWPLSE